MEDEHRRHPSIADLERTRVELQREVGSCGRADERVRIRAELRRADASLADVITLQESVRDLPVLWSAIYGEGAGQLALFTGRRTLRGLTEPRTAYFGWPEAATAAAQWAAAEARNQRDVYHCAHLLTAPQRRKRFAAPLHSLYVDLDSDVRPAPVLAPTVTVCSSPGHFHCYFRLAAPVPPAVGESLNKRLALALGADPSGWDLTQLLRVPGTRNLKYAERPWVCLVELSDAVYQPAELDAWLPPRPIVSGLVGGGGANDGRVRATAPRPVRLTGRAQQIWQGTDAKETPEGTLDRSASLVKIARVLLTAGVSEEELVAVLAERDAALGWRKYSDRDDAVDQYRRIVNLVSRRPQ